MLTLKLNGKWKSTVFHLPLMAMFVLLISTLPILFQREIAMPHKKDELGWSVLEDITRKPHPYNSDENLRVRDYLIQQIEKIKEAYTTWNCSQANPINVP
jgi:hypothetical protein